jgi:O-antigen/teichoic acid export membrane protein
LGTAWVGYYSPGYLLGSMIAMFVSPIATVLPVALCKYYDHGNINVVETIMSLTIKYLLALTIPSVVGLSILSKPMLMILSTPDIAEQSYLVTPFVAIGMLFMGMASVMSNVIYIVKKTSISMKISLMAALIKLFLLLTLVQLAGVMGAAVATLLIFLFIFMANKHFALIFLKIRLDYVFILKSVLASSIMSLLIFFWMPNSLIELLGYILISMLIYLLVILMMNGIDKDEIKFIRSLLNA